MPYSTLVFICRVHTTWIGTLPKLGTVSRNGSHSESKADFAIEISALVEAGAALICVLLVAEVKFG